MRTRAIALFVAERYCLGQIGADGKPLMVPSEEVRLVMVDAADADVAP